MAFIRAVLDFTKRSVPVRRIRRKFLCQCADAKFIRRIRDIELFKKPHDACDFHAKLRGRFFLGTDKILFITDAKRLEFRAKLLNQRFDFFGRIICFDR